VLKNAQNMQVVALCVLAAEVLLLRLVGRIRAWHLVVAISLLVVFLFVWLVATGAGNPHGGGAGVLVAAFAFIFLLGVLLVVEAFAQ
jgi:hypothetical protein